MTSHHGVCQVPLFVGYITRQVCVADDLVQAHLEAVVCPRSKLHGTLLVIEWEVFDIYLACAFEEARLRPEIDLCVVVDQSVRGSAS